MWACLHAQLLQSHLILCDPWTIAHQAPLSMGFSRQYWNGLLRPPSGELNPCLLCHLHCRQILYPLSKVGSPIKVSDQFSHSVVSGSLRPHESQHTRPPCPSPTPRVYSDSRPSSQWCHPAISSSVVLFSSCPQSLPASESWQMCTNFICSLMLISILYVGQVI